VYKNSHPRKLLPLLSPLLTPFVCAHSATQRTTDAQFSHTQGRQASFCLSERRSLLESATVRKGQCCARRLTTQWELAARSCNSTGERREKWTRPAISCADIAPQKCIQNVFAQCKNPTKKRKTNALLRRFIAEKP
jgi:hypothetical protein